MTFRSCGDCVKNDSFSVLNTCVTRSSCVCIKRLYLVFQIDSQIALVNAPDNNPIRSLEISNFSVNVLVKTGQRFLKPSFPINLLKT